MSIRYFWRQNATPSPNVFTGGVGTEGFFVIGIDLLKFVPKTENDWRDRTLITLNGLAFDRLLVTRGNSFELQRDPASKSSWRIAPMQARADDEHIQELLQELESLRVRSFVTDDPKADVDTFGLQTPELQITFSQGTNDTTVLQFWKIPHQRSPTGLCPPSR